MSKFPNCGKCGLPLKKKELDSGFHDACKTVVLPGQTSFAEQDKNFMPIDQWSGCYPSNWKGVITEESFAHPAKFSSKLIRKIYEHMVAEGWLPVGSVVIDPFGGVALGALFAMQNGCTWVGCELEERFVQMGNDNIELWDRKFNALPKWKNGSVLLQGDSRFLSQVLSGANASVSSPPFGDVVLHRGGPAQQRGGELHSNYAAAVSSPPYADGSQHTSGDDLHPEKMQGGTFFGVGINGVVSSPPYAGMEVEKNSKSINLEKMYETYKASGGGQSYEAFCATQLKHSGGYQSVVSSPPYADARIQQEGSDNAANMNRASDKGRYQAVLSSPPYADSINSDNGIDVTKINGKDKRVGKNSQATQETRYGTQSAQLGAMKATDKGFRASVSSPPFLQTSGGTNVTSTTGPLADKSLLDRHAAGNSNAGYGDTEGNMGSVSPDDFWVSARQIVEQVFQVLEPGGHAVWVCKDYVRGGQRIEFCRMWMELCEAVGFVTLHEHHAMLVREQGVSSTTMEGLKVDHSRSSKSFFRRIAEKKGSPPIDFEVVYCMVKPN